MRTMQRMWKPLGAVAAALAGVAVALAAPPKVSYPDEALVALYEEAWREARERTLEAPEGAPVKRYMDEHVYEDQIWVWDSCFMAQFTKYAAEDYPGIETLEALYVPVVEQRASPLRVHLFDNPPLFAWCEWLQWQFHGDRRRVEEILLERQLLQRHFAWFAAPPTGRQYAASPNPIRLQAASAGNGAKGFIWWGNGSGMDNTPRGRGAGGWGGILWVDAIAQQALAAQCIAQLYDALGQTDAAAPWRATFEALAREINTYYWDEQDGFYYDIALADGTPCRVKTLASYWPLLAGVAPPERARRAFEHLRNPAEFGGERPFPSLSRDDPDFHAQTGEYWRGGIWLPTAYMTLKALERYGERALADDLARRLLRQMARTYACVSPATIWECYSPSADAPSSEYGRRVRPDFCGWSALGPINLFLEHELGLRACRADLGLLCWEPPAGVRYPLAIEHLAFGPYRVSLWADGASIRLRTNRALTLQAAGRTFSCPPGEHTFSLAPEHP